MSLRSSQTYPTPNEGVFISEGAFTLHNFQFQDGGSLPELRLHYTTLGQPQHNSAGQVNNAVLILYGTGGSGDAFLRPEFADVLFAPGQLLDANRYFIILPDSIGHGQSSKPSDGLRANFPAYTYDDMVLAQYRLVTERLKVNHLRLVMGTSMGGMHTWVWGYTYPDFVDALFPLASLPVEIAGRNRMIRKMISDSIRQDPAWQGGNYQTQPPGLISAIYSLLFMVSSPLQWQQEAPTREAAEALLAQKVADYASRFDANDMLYQFDASRFYNPAPHLEKITAPLHAVNSADDQVNPPELGLLEREIGKVKQGRYTLLPISPETRGHGTHTLAALWQAHLAALLQETDQSERL